MSFFTGNVVNKPEHGSLDWVKICEKSSKVITFIDLAGHERYLKTTVFGMTGHAPDFGMLMVRMKALEAAYLLFCGEMCIIFFSGRCKRWYRGHDERTLGPCSRVECTGVRCGNQD